MSRRSSCRRIRVIVVVVRTQISIRLKYRHLPREAIPAAFRTLREHPEWAQSIFEQQTSITHADNVCPALQRHQAENFSGRTDTTGQEPFSRLVFVVVAQRF